MFMCMCVCAFYEKFVFVCITTGKPPVSRMQRRQRTLRQPICIPHAANAELITGQKAACCEGRPYYGTEKPTGKPHAAKAELITGQRKSTEKPHAAKAELMTGQKNRPESRTLPRQNLLRDRKTNMKAARNEGRTHNGTEKPTGTPHAAKAELITGQKNLPESRMLRRQTF
jgi:hypothetical protein